MKRLTKKEWNALGIHNSYGLCQRGGKGLYVTYSSAMTGRVSQCARWQVIKPGDKTDASGPWYNHGHKTFNVYRREDKEAKRIETLAWASFVYDIKGEWERDPWGNYHPAGTLEAAQNAGTLALSSA